jgi:BirA family biotin operon repressor/biotin-[acetyl-CoA-carboxylase] ligase
MSDFDLEQFRALFAARPSELGGAISWTGSTASTNDDALAAAKAGAPHGAIFGAETQTRGRGRRGSAWLSPPSAGLWFSVLLRPELRAEVVSGLALAAGLAVRAAVAGRVAAAPLVKWPNDVLCEGRKLAGVLVESQVAGARVSHVVVGIGVNVTQAAFPEELAGIATSLTLLSASSSERESLLLDILAELAARLTSLTETGFAGLTAELNTHDALRGKRLRVEAHEGEGAGIDGEGRLLLATASGRVEAISSGHVELVSA